MRQALSTAATAAIVSLLTLTVAGAMAQSEPDTERTITPGGTNADGVDGKHAVSFTNARGRRAGKLVATNQGGWLPSNIVQPLWHLIKNKPAGFADDVDNEGVTKVTVRRAESLPKSIPNGGDDYVEVACPPGTVVIGGGGYNTWFAHLADSHSNGNGWRVYDDNDGGSSANVYAVAHCLSIEPADRLEIAGKRNAPGPAGKHR